MLSRLLVVTTLLICATPCIGKEPLAVATPPRPASEYPCYQPSDGEPSGYDLTLESSIDPASEGWLIRYKVTNTSGADRYLVARIPYPSFGSTDYDPGNYYLTAKPNGIIEISKRFFIQPRECQVRMAVPPWPPRVIKVSAGQVFAEEFIVHKPLQIRYPYDQLQDGLPALPGNPSQAIFCLGVAYGADAAPADQRLLCNGPFSL